MATGLAGRELVGSGEHVTVGEHIDMGEVVQEECLQCIEGILLIRKWCRRSLCSVPIVVLTR